MDKYELSVRTWDEHIRDKISSAAHPHEDDVTVDVKDSGIGFYTGGELLFVTVIAVTANVLTIAYIIYEWLKDRNKKRTTISIEIDGTELNLNGLEPDAIAAVLAAYENRNLLEDQRKKLALYMGKRLHNASNPDRMDHLHNICALQVNVPFDQILPLVESDDTHLQVQAVHTLRVLKYPEIIDILDRLLQSPEWYVRMELANELVHIDESNRWRLLEPLAQDESSFVRDRVALVLGELGGPRSIRICKTFLRDRNWGVQVRAAESLKEAIQSSSFSDGDVVNELLERLNEFRKKARKFGECRQIIDKLLDDVLPRNDH